MFRGYLGSMIPDYCYVNQPIGLKPVSLRRKAVLPKGRHHLPITMHDVIVIGGGQAGLATAYHLQKADVNYLVLDAHTRIGDSWRKRWKGLRLFTPNRYNALPGDHSSPGEPYGLPDRMTVADYLEAYVARNQLNVVNSAQVVSLRKNPTHFEIETSDGTIRQAVKVIIAAGAYRTPRVLDFAERLRKTVKQAHTSEIEDPAEWLPADAKSVLVVGAGASGNQLSQAFAHLAQTRKQKLQIILAGEDPGALPRKVLGRDVYDYLYGLHILPLRVDSLMGRVLAKAPTKGEIRVGEFVDAVAKRMGIVRRGKLSAVNDHRFEFADGEPIDNIDAVVFATGYDNQYPFIQIPGALTSAGKPIHSLGISPVDGLYWMGLHLMRRINSSLLGGVAQDAKEIVGKALN